MCAAQIMASQWMTPRYPSGSLKKILADADAGACISTECEKEFSREMYAKLRSEFGLPDVVRDIPLALSVAGDAIRLANMPSGIEVAIFLAMQESSLASRVICGDIEGEERAWLEPACWFAQIRSTLGLRPSEDIWVNAACASGNYGLAAAYDYVNESPGRHALVVASFSTFPGASSAFVNVGIAASRACKPFHAERDGTLVSEGAAALLLASSVGASYREPECALLGYGLTCDAYNQVAPDPSGDSALNCVLGALDSARITAEDIGYINAHGTGTWANDEIEADVIKKAGLNGARRSSTKAYTGHCMLASALIEACICSQIMTTGLIPDDTYLGPARPLEDERPFNLIMSNSFGFGGANSSIVLGR